MKIAIATDDFVTVTGHIGRCNGFLIFDVEDGKILNTEQRENNFTHHKTSHIHEHSHSHGHSHASLVNGLNDCSHLICTSAGWRLRDDFEKAGKELIFTDETVAELAAINFSKGTLNINPEGACHSH